MTDEAGAHTVLPFQVPAVIAKELARFLEDQIIFGELAPGSRVIEEDIVRRYKISRSPVREALRSLEQEGLVVRESRRGVWVSNMHLDDLNEVYSCRLALEGLATELAAENRTSQDIVEIKRAIDDLAAKFAAADPREFFRANLELSRKIHRAARNKTLERLLTSIGKQSYRYRFLAYSRMPEMMRASVEGHKEILAAMERNNAKYARVLMEDMIRKSWDSIREVLKSNFGATSNTVGGK